MNTRFNLTLRLALLLCMAGILLAICGGLLALAEPGEGESALSATETVTVDLSAQTPDAEPTLPGDGETTDTPDNTQSPSSAEPDGSLLTPSDSEQVPDLSSAVPDGSTQLPELSDSEPIEGSGDVSSAELITTPIPATTTKKPSVPNYSTDAVTLTGALQSVPAGPMSTDPAASVPVTTTVSQGGNTDPQTAAVTTTNSDPADDLPAITDAPAVTTAPDAADDDTDRGGGLLTLAIIFSAIAVLAIGAVILTRAFRLR